jgi:hypothetical protein
MGNHKKKKKLGISAQTSICTVLMPTSVCISSWPTQDDQKSLGVEQPTKNG